MTRIHDIVSLYDLDASECVFAITQLAAAATAAGRADLALTFEPARAAANDAAKLDEARRFHRKLAPTRTAGSADQDVDRAATVIHRRLDSEAAMGAYSPLSEQAARLRDQAFPGGLLSMHRATLVDQGRLNTIALAALRDAAYADLLTALRLGAAVDAFVAACAEFDRALIGPSIPTATQVRAAIDLAQTGLQQAIGRVYGEFAFNDPQAVAARDQILTPILTLNHQIHERYARRQDAALAPCDAPTTEVGRPAAR